MFRRECRTGLGIEIWKGAVGHGGDGLGFSADMLWVPEPVCTNAMRLKIAIGTACGIRRLRCREGLDR